MAEQHSNRNNNYRPADRKKGNQPQKSNESHTQRTSKGGKGGSRGKDR